MRTLDPGPPSVHADALIVGGGPAGLSAALVLARALRSVMVIDGDEQGVKARSTWPQVNHNLLGWPGGIAAKDLRDRGREQLALYESVTRWDDRVDSIWAEDGRFYAAVSRGILSARIVLLATGVQDRYPEFPGWQDYVGRSMHWCLACDAYEARGTAIVVVGDDATAVADALQLKRFSEDVALLTHEPRGSFDSERRDRLAAHGVRLVEDRVVAAEGSRGQLSCLHTAGGFSLPCEHLFSLLPSGPRNHLAAGLGLRMDEKGHVCVDAEQRATTAGVFAAGDLTRVHSHQLATALHEGTQAGHAMSHELLDPELRS